MKKDGTCHPGTNAQMKKKKDPGARYRNEGQVGHVPCQVGHVPCPGWACPMSRLGMSHFLFGAHFGSHLGTHFLFGAHFGSRLGTHFLGHILGPIWGPICPGTYWGPLGPGWEERAALEAEGRLFRGPGAEPPGIAPIWACFGLFCHHLHSSADLAVHACTHKPS